MNATRVFCLLLCLILPAAGSRAQYLFVTDSVHITAITTVDSIRVTAGGMLIVDDSIAVLGNMAIDSGGVVTHSLRLLAGLRLTVAGTLSIASGGAIDVSGKGLLGGNQAGNAFGLSGETFNSTGDAIVAGSDASIGSSYGGWGASAPPPVANPPYGLLEAPAWLGSGAGGSGRGGVGGNGGGRIMVIAGECVVNGAIRANGLDGIMGGGFPGGGGSGGSVLLTAGILSGAGAIQANGGASASYNARGGAGGGGRVAIFFNTMSLSTEEISACGGGGDCWHGSAGTIYLKDNGQALGTLIIDNARVVSELYTPFRTNLEGFRTLHLRNSGQLHPDTANVASFSVEQPVLLTGTSALWLGPGVTMAVTNTTGFDVEVQGGSTFLLDTNTVLSANAVWADSGTLTLRNTDLAFPTGTDLVVSRGGMVEVLGGGILSLGVLDTTNLQRGTLYVSGGSRLDVASDQVYVGVGNTLIKDGAFGVVDSISSMTVAGVVTHSVRYLPGLRLNVTGTLAIPPGGAIDVSGKGLLAGYQAGNAFGPSGETFNATGDTIKAGSLMGGGGSFGGQGANASQTPLNLPYGLLESPSLLGSGGGGNYRSGPGGNGGGRIRVIAGECVVSGAIRANGIAAGGTGGFYGGGGSGGSVWLTTGNLSGTGVLEASGGFSARYNNTGGAGGGGRVAIYFGTMTLPVDKISAYGGAGDCSHGSAGTIYLKDNAQAVGSLIIDNANITCDLYTPWCSGLTSFQSLRVIRAGKLEVGEEVNIEGPLLVSGGGMIGRR